jgi:predicted kinase
VALVGASGSGKSTFGRKHFLPTEVLSSDFFRGLISDDQNDQSVTASAFDSLYYVASQRLAKGKLTVIDATNVKKNSRAKIVELARRHDVLAVILVLNVSLKTGLKRDGNDRIDTLVPRSFKKAGKI